MMLVLVSTLRYIYFGVIAVGQIIIHSKAKCIFVGFQVKVSIKASHQTCLHSGNNKVHRLALYKTKKHACVDNRYD